MKRNFSFSKFRIKEQKTNLNFMNTFCKRDIIEKPKSNIFVFNPLLKNKIKIIPFLKINKQEEVQKEDKISEKTHNPEFIHKFSSPLMDTKIKMIKNDIDNVIINSKKKDKFKTTISLHKKKLLSIPKNKTQIKPLHNFNHNYVININNNINNSYQIKMQNNQEMNKDINNVNKYEFEKFKLWKSEEGIKIYNSTNQKTALTELSDLSCFKSNKKFFNLNSINSLVNNDNDLTYSEETNSDKIFNNSVKPKNSKNFNIKKKIYINPIEFQHFCKEIEEKLNL